MVARLQRDSLQTSHTLPGPSIDTLKTLLDNLPLEFEWHLTTKIFDVNRTLTALTAEVCHSVTVGNVRIYVFNGQPAIRPSLDG